MAARNKPAPNFYLEDLTSLKRLMESDQTGLLKLFEKALDACIKSYRQGGKIIAFGNGGSASDAEHLVGEMLGKFLYDRNPLPAVAITQASPSLTAIGNDYGYEFIFERQLRGLGKKGDIAIGITTSGNSKNVIKAFEAARKMGIFTIALTGAADSKASEIAHITLRSPSRETPRVQEIHALLIHSLCRGIEARLFPREMPSLPAIKRVAAKDLESFAKSIESHRSVFTNGCFDILHPGHITLLKKARALGDLLILGLNSDGSVKRLKGKGRPFNGFEDRAMVLEALSCVDYIIGFDEDTPLELIKKVKPKVLVKGGDYKIETIVGSKFVLNLGGEVHVIPLVKGHSTTRILENA